LFEEIKTDSGSDLYVSDAAFYKVQGKRAIVFVPGYIFNKESWLFLAKEFKKQGVASIAINGKTSAMVIAAVEELKSKGYTDIALVGGSMGAVAVMSAVNQGLEGVSKVALLSPLKSMPIKNSTIKKLFVVSNEEKVFPLVEKLYSASSQPKQIETFSGKSHAQFIFYSSGRQQLIDLLKGFISQP
jgi:pimeloyl-ACP methyl ester carboxylesterase